MRSVVIFVMVLVLSPFLCSFTIASTNVSGNITTDTTWNLAGSPYILVGNVTVNSGVTLTLAPGIKLAFPNLGSPTYVADLSVAGRLEAVGASIDLTGAYSGSGDPRSEIFVNNGGVISLSDCNVTLSYAGNAIRVQSGGHAELSQIVFNGAGSCEFQAGSSGALNDLSGNNWSLNIASDAVTVHYNDFSGASVAVSGGATATYDMENNWWGTIDPNQIEAKITHHADDPARPWVDFKPWLEFPLLEQAFAPPDPTVLQITGIGILRLADAGHPIDTSKPTIVLTHGWNPGCFGLGDEPGETPDWITAMKDSIFAKQWGSNWNVVWWDWIEKATSCSPAGPAKQVQWQGNYLGNALIDTLGTNYAQYIHFIGFSLGAGVNRWAVDMIHNNGWNPSKTHVTILDAAEIGDLADSVRPIPDEAVYIDNFITAFGDLHEEARNVILTQGAPILPTDILDYIDFHGRSNEWYDLTIDNPTDSLMGHRWSFENGGFSGAPVEGACYAQTLRPYPNNPEQRNVITAHTK